MVPVDFSETSKKAVNYGLSLALEFEAALILTHILPYNAVGWEDTKMQLLELIPPEYRNRIETIVKSGAVRPEILETIEGQKVDLVVVGTHGRPYFERLLLGSVTERMLRKVNVPILTVSHLDPATELHTPGIVPLRRILYATDLGDDSETGLQFAIRLARGLDATLTVVHVLQAIDVVFNGGEAAAYLSAYPVEIRVRAEERLNRLVALASDGSVPVTTVLAEGVPYAEINRLAHESKSDLVVINLQGKGRLERALLGSTAERVIRTATVPVLSLPMPATYSEQWAAA
jgi:nucleotide-binding universal stress UspA family protein